MKNKFLLLAMLLLAACTSEIEEQSVPSSFESVTMSAKDFECEKIGRTSFEITDKGAGFSWAANDTVGIFPEEGAQAYFPMVEGAGTKTASFTGGGWALKPSSKYMAYYPMQGKFYLDKTAIPVDYTGQTQTGNASTAHLGQYDYMAAVGTSPQQGKVNFNFEHLGALVQLNMSLPAETHTDVTLSCDEAVFIQKGTVDLTAETPKIMPVGEKSKEIKIHLSSFTTTAQNENVQIYFLVAPVDLTGKTLKVFVNKGIQQLNFESITLNKPWKAGFSYALQIKGEPKPIVEWVDLGLPSGLLWASCNIGASYPEDYGDYFAWGEIKPKEYYDRHNCLTDCKPIYNISGDPNYDAATANWGKTARIPTEAELSELCLSCNSRKIVQKGVVGDLITGPNGKSIFLPRAGYRYHDGLKDVGKGGGYWSSTSYSDDEGRGVSFKDSDVDWEYGWYRYYGRSIRPVKSPEKPVIEWVDLGLPSGILWASCNIGATRPEEYGDYFAWGEIKPKDSYDISNSLTHQKPMSDISGNPQYDAATANWGTPARMPRMEDIEELINFCTTTWTTNNGVVGRYIKGQNDNSIFIPASGYVDGVDNSEVGKCGCCRSSTPNSNFGDKCSYGLNIESPDFFIGSGWDRYLGIPVRPVREK